MNKILSKEVSLYLAKLLRKNEFDELCKSYYIGDNPRTYEPSTLCKNSRLAKNCFAASTIGETINFIYDKYNIWIEVRRTSNFKEIRFQSYINEKPLTGELGGYVSHSFPLEAYEEAIKYTLLNLIK